MADMEVLQVMVGSQAHDLAGETSDIDKRAVFVTPTSELLSVQNADKAPRGTSWVEGEKEDHTAYEVGHFLHLALQSNPSILEVFMAPVMHATGKFWLPEAKQSIGNALRQLFPFVWSADLVVKAFGGYSHNQMKKFISEDPKYKDRSRKYAVAYIRVLLQGIELLSTGSFSLEVKSNYVLPKGCSESAYSAMGMARCRQGWMGWPVALRAIKAGEYTTGFILDMADPLRRTLDILGEEGPYAHRQACVPPVNDALIQIRQAMWNDHNGDSDE